MEVRITRHAFEQFLRRYAGRKTSCPYARLKTLIELSTPERMTGGGVQRLLNHGAKPGTEYRAVREYRIVLVKGVVITFERAHQKTRLIGGR